MAMMTMTLGKLTMTWAVQTTVKLKLKLMKRAGYHFALRLMRLPGRKMMREVSPYCRRHWSLQLQVYTGSGRGRERRLRVWRDLVQSVCSFIPELFTFPDH